MRVELVGHLFQDTYSIALHSHQCWEYVYYTSGSGILYVDGEEIPFMAGELFVMPPGVVHGERAEGGFQNYHCSISSCDFSAKSYVKISDRDGAFLSLMEGMYREYHLQRKNWRSIVDTHLQLLDQYIYSFLQEPTLNYYVSVAVTAMLDNLSNSQFSVDAMISEFPFHRNYFVRLFQGQIGKTPLRFLTDHRISYAIQLLETRESSGLSLKEISRMAGYQDYYYFSRVFKKSTGRAPSDWK